MPSGTRMLIAAMSLVHAQAMLNHSGVISSKGIPAVQPVQKLWGSSPCHKPGDRQHG